MGHIRGLSLIIILIRRVAIKQNQLGSAPVLFATEILRLTVTTKQEDTFVGAIKLPILMKTPLFFGEINDD